jgi:SpoIIIAH-like protein
MRTKIIIAVVALVVVVAVYFLFFRKKAPLAAAKVGQSKVSSTGASPKSAAGVALQGVKALQSAPSSIGALFSKGSSSDDNSSSSDDSSSDDTSSDDSSSDDD